MCFFFLVSLLLLSCYFFLLFSSLAKRARYQEHMEDKDITQLSYEELQALAKSYGVTDEASPSVIQLDALVCIAMCLLRE